MTGLLAAGRVVEAILLLVVVEALLLFYLFSRRGIGPHPARVLPNLLSGGCLLLALRAALADSPALLIAPWLALAGVAHAVDLALRWRGD